MIYSQEAAAIPKEELRSRGEILEKRLQSSDLSEQDKQTELMNYLDLLNEQRAADVGVWFSECKYYRYNKDVSFISCLCGVSRLFLGRGLIH